MEVFGMAQSPDSSAFDYLKEATAKRGQNQNESISFLLDASAIANDSVNDIGNDNHTNGVTKTDTGPVASTKEQKQTFYTLHDTAVSEFLSPKSPSTRSRTTGRGVNSTPNNHSNRKTTANSEIQDSERTQSQFASPSLSIVKQENAKNQTKSTSISNSMARPKINTRRSLSSTNNNNNTNSAKKVNTKTITTPGSASVRRGGQPTPQTPGGFWTTNTESKTFVNGLLSPFSPLLHSQVHKQKKTNNLATIHDGEQANDHSNNPNDTDNRVSLNQTLKRQREEYMQYVSLQPCRKVSVVVRVAAVDEDKDAKRCIFPHFKDDVLPSGGSLSSPTSNNMFATPKGKTTSNVMSTPLSAKSTNSRLSSPTHRRDVVVVNPTAFGKYIPSQVTMETAKLVAQVANIPSEDWARLYEFHHVMWPTRTQSSENNTKPSIVGSPQGSPKAEDLASSYNTMDSLSRAVVQDLLAEHESSLLISMGHESSCFGTTANGEGNTSSIGLWPKIMNQCAAMLETKGVVRLTMVEILEGGNKAPNSADSFRDLLAPADQKPASIRLRHHDMKGAVLEGLCEVEIDSMPALLEALAKSRQRQAQRRKQNGKNGNSSGIATAVIGTLHYWEHAVSFELNKPSNATVTCVELSTNQSSSGTKNTKNINDALESITHRKSVVSLGQALRQLLLQQSRGTGKSLGLSTSDLNPVICYRETTLTKVLQRAMENSKIVLIASISPLSRDYENTVFTLNYLRRMLVKPGNTLTSPFGGKFNEGSGHIRTPPKTAKTDNRSNPNNLVDVTNVSSFVNRSILSSPEAIENKERLKSIANNDPKFLEEQLVTDPRQRLAKYFSPTREEAKPSSNVLDRMEDSQISTRGTPSAISLHSGNDASTLGSHSHGANSYSGPIDYPEQEERRQMVESPGSNKQQNSRQSVTNHESELESGEWNSEDEIAHKRQLQMEQDNWYNTGGDEGSSHDDNDGYGDDMDVNIDVELDDDTESQAPTLPPINPEGCYLNTDDNQSSDDDGHSLPDVPIGVTDATDDYVQEEFGDTLQDGNDVEPREATEEDSPSQIDPFDTDTQGEGSSLGLLPSSSPVPPSPIPPSFDNGSHDQDESTEDPANQTNYDLPDDPRETVDQIRDHRPPPSPRSPYGVLNSYGSNYSVTLKTSKSKEYAELTNEREELRATVAKLADDLQKVTEESKTNIHHYEAEIKQLYAKLEMAEKAKNELENVASQAITARTSSEEQIETFEEEKEQLQRTVDSLRNDMARMSEMHESQLFRHRAEIDDFQSKLERARETQKEIEDIADEAVTAHKAQVEETKVLTTERDELYITIESLKRTMETLERGQEDHVAKYHQEIRELHSQLEETKHDKRCLKKEADDSRFQLDTMSEKLEQLTREREELQSSLLSVKGSAQKAIGDHDDYLRRYKNEIQQLKTELDDARSEKLRVEKSVDELRLEKDDLEQRCKGLEEELSSSRSNTLRLEKIRREEQETIHKMNIELRRHESEQLDMEHFKNELERLKRHKDHLESLVAHRKVESSAALTQLEEELADAKRKIILLEDSLSTARMHLSSSEKQNKELKDKLGVAYDKSSQLSRQLSERDDDIRTLQASCDNLESLRIADGDLIAKLKDDLRNKESVSIDVEQLRNKFSRLAQDHDQLKEMMECRKIEYEQSMEEKRNELSAYISRVDTLEMELEKASAIEGKYRQDAEVQLRELQTSEAKLIQNLRQRDSRIDQLESQMDTQRREINALREREVASSHAENEIIRLQGQLNKLEMTLNITNKEREEAMEKAQTESRSHKSVLNELKQSRDEIYRYKNTVKDLNQELDQRQEENLKAKEKIFQMESTLRAFKNETKERVRTFVDRENDRNGVLERTRDENQHLNSNLRDMNNIVSRLRRERDICFQSLQEGRQKLSELSSRKETLANFDDLYSTPSMNRRSRTPQRNLDSRGDARASLRPYPPPVEAVTTRASNRPEIFVTSYQLGSPSTPAEERAEQIAACIAQNAKDTLAENLQEVSQIKSQIYRLEDERSEQVASLKAKVSKLEKELTIERIDHRRSLEDARAEAISSLRQKVRNLERELSYERLGNQTPVMGTSSRKHNHFLDYDEKREN